MNHGQTWTHKTHHGLNLGKPPPSPYNILCAWSQDEHPNVILSRDFQLGVLKFPKLELPRFWRPISLCADLQLRWGLKKNYNPCWELSNGILLATYMQGNRGDSWLSVVGSQIANLTLGPSFGHNLYFKCPNGSSKPILDIYVPRVFQWYEELLNPMSLTSKIALWKFRSTLGF